MDTFIGHVILFPGTFSLMYFQLCDGKELTMSQNNALYTIVGDVYGGNGRTTFALPDLRGRVAIGQGQGPGLKSYTVGDQGGRETYTLNSQHLPVHTHNLMVNNTGSTDTSPGDSVVLSNGPVFGKGPSALTGNIYSGSAPDELLSGDSLGKVGGDQSIEIIQPVLAMNYQIAVIGIYPSRA